VASACCQRFSVRSRSACWHQVLVGVLPALKLRDRPVPGERRLDVGDLCLGARSDELAVLPERGVEISGRGAERGQRLPHPFLGAGHS
jgi:hypothetical protein